MTTWSVQQLRVPTSPQSADGRLLHALVDAQNEVTRAAWGSDDFAVTPRRTLSLLQHQDVSRRLRLLAVDDAHPEHVLGFARLDLPLRDNTHTGWLDLGVRPAHRGQGIGTSLLAAALAVAQGAGRTHLMTETEQASEPAPGDGTMSAPTGEGRVSRDDPSVRFALAHGWQLEQVARHSRLTLPLDAGALAAHREAAATAAGRDYRTVTWTDATPDRWLDQMAELHTRMSTDEPTAGLDVEEEAWDAQRVRDDDAESLDRDEQLLTTVVEHVPSGRLVAYSQLMFPPHTDEFVWQEDTLVLREHRGHRLGMLVKAVQLQELAERRPAVRRISTWNAEENRWMLAINVALGFRPAGGGGVWQRRVEPA
ncbi:GNAT family N-acetyltransferase [Cellulomonas wangsupingiae]|uniref:GNAT family N-acetyltransferase n=1 Tax=Cellulomonas wangsupingiae TaxID=2968085 RepID=UPI001D0EBD92|nr:GNAT family N-acetyltransferase [Cellulomonas wangsupingiae]MCM0638756.1 GNAT family N-acetyltransferase [Cellulomonas wangsupingiae]